MLTMWTRGTALCAAQVVTLDITSREPMSAGQPDGAAGPFELTRGRIHGEVDPADPHQRNHPGSRPGATECARQGRVRRDLRADQAGRFRESLARHVPPTDEGRVPTPANSPPVVLFCVECTRYFIARSCGVSSRHASGSAGQLPSRPGSRAPTPESSTAGATCSATSTR